MIKKRKNIDLTLDVLKTITIAAVNKGVSPKKLIENIVEGYANRVKKGVYNDGDL